ncbi:translation initiation factor IF-2 [Rickettsiales bacterium LUAb2]
MSNSDSTDDKKSTLKLSGTLSLGKSLEDIKKNIAKKDQGSKKQTIVEVVNKKKAKPKAQEQEEADKTVDSTQAVESNNVKNTAEADTTNLSKQEQENRFRALERSKEIKSKEAEDDKVETDEISFVGPNIVVKSVDFDNNDIVEPALDLKKTSEVKPNNNVSHYNEKANDTSDDTEAENNKKKAAAKKKAKSDTVRSWKDAYYTSEEDNEDIVAEASVVVEEEYVEVVAARPLADIRRKGKTKKDKSKKRIETGIKHEVEILESELVKDIAHKMAEKPRIVVDTLRKLGVEVDEYSEIDADTAELLVTELGHIAKKSSKKQEIEALYNSTDNEQDLQKRPPVVTIMGHVDHGKTSLLDYIRKTNVVSKESGGITQHIGAYQITLNDGKKNNENKITFLDTPGHEAFTEMRARGALVTDIVILVVAADDGLKPQSIEAISHAKAANVPIIVAINKMDKPEANPGRVKTELLQHNLVVEEMGGEVLCVEISAIKGTGIPVLLENILLQADLLELTANPKRKASGTIIEAKIEKGKGFVATVIIQNGTLKKGDIFVSALVTGKVRLINNDLGKMLNEALPSMPVEIIGFNGEVAAGDDFIVVASEAEANKIVDFRKQQSQSNKNIQVEGDDLHHLLKTLGNDKKKLSIIIKADVHGSKEAILASIAKITHNEVEVKIVHSGIGQITESDVLLAKTAGGLIYGFNVRANNQAKDLANREKIDIRYYAIIYDLLDDIKNVLGGLLSPKIVENITGYAEVREVFSITKVGKIAGCYVTEGIIKKAAFARVLRDGTVIHEGVLSQLKRFKDDVKEVKASYECGIMFQNFQDIVVGDVIECFEKNSIERTL